MLFAQDDVAHAEAAVSRQVDGASEYLLPAEPPLLAEIRSGS